MDSLRAASSPSENYRTSIRVGINCLDVNPSFVGGVTTYTVGLLEGFASAGNGCRFHIFVTEGNQHLFEQFRNRDHFKVIVAGGRLFPLKTKVCRAALLSRSSELFKFTNDLAFEKIRELMDAESDVLYTPSPVLRCFNSRKPTVLTMHDIQHVHHPEFFSWPRRLSRNITYGLSARHASYLQANSQYTKKDFLAHFPELSAEQIEVIPVGVNVERFATANGSSDVRERYDLPERFLLYPAQLWPHKNHITVLQALKQIENKNGLKIPLVLTGGEYAAASRVFRFISDQSMRYVCHLGKVPGQDMVGLYHKAAFVIAAGVHESSSAPTLESAAAGTPVIASRIPPFEELAEVLQLNLFDPLDVDGLARLIFDLWDDIETASAQAAVNRRQIACYSFENTAQKYVRLFERVVNT
jgi:glycosyltransferase involved in cell wall biosynthesis